MEIGKLPVTPRQLPIIPIERWRIVDDKLVKQFKFDDLKKRNAFLFELINYENETYHCAELDVKEDCVTICVYTKGINKVTEIDKEYASYADVLFRELKQQVNNCE